MKLSRFIFFSSGILFAGFLAGCASRPSKSDPTAEYLAWLEKNPGANLSQTEGEAAAARFKEFLSVFTEEKLRTDTQTVYAPDAYLNDTLKTVRGSAAIQHYFLETLSNTESVTVDFTDVARSGNDYYFRWVMDIRFKKFRRGQTTRSLGMTHVRFNANGQVLLHQDYWDSAQGLFEHVPVIGHGIRLIKSRL